MTLKYSLSENDFLQHQLFISSTSETVKKKRRNTWIMTTLVLLCLGFLFYQSGNKFFTYYFIGLGITALFFYPLYLKSYYKKHYQKFVADTYKNCFGEESTVIFREDYVEAFDKTGESKINYTQVEKIIEIGGYFFLRMKTGGSLIIPKRIEEVNTTRTELQNLANKVNVMYVTDLDWKWK